MVGWKHLPLGVALLVASASAEPILARDEAPPVLFGNDIVPGTFIAELADSEVGSITIKTEAGRPTNGEETDTQDTVNFLGHVDRNMDVGNVTERFRYRSRAFNGVSFHLSTPGAVKVDVETTLRQINALPQVKNLWPVRVIPRPEFVPDQTKPAMSRRSGGVTGRAESGYTPHVQVQVDKLHAEGYTGKGIRIGVVDTGIDYKHPALGGCFGPGCLVEYGTDLSGDDYNGDNLPVPDDDPMDSCVGHGTHVAGIIAAQKNPYGFIGAAPGAILGAYRVFGCTGGSGSDVILQAIIRAYEDGSDIITGSLGRPGGWPNDPLAVAASRIVGLGVPCTFAIGNTVGGAEGVFGASTPSVGKGVMSITSFENADLASYDAATGAYSTRPNPQFGGLASIFALWGSTFELTMKPQFGAPGGGIMSTLPGSMGGYGVYSGTSMATPAVAGIVALIIEVRNACFYSLPRNLLGHALTSRAGPRN